MKTSKVVACTVALCAAVALSGQRAMAQNWVSVWSDEFNWNGGIDPNRWGFEVGAGGWGNNELEYYTNNRQENCRVQLFPNSSNGRLIIEARKEAFAGSNYTSARLFSQPRWTYGRMEINAKLPTGRGLWPAIWMLPTDWTYGNGSWPDNGELDIMEQVGYDPLTIHGSIHTNRNYFKLGNQITATTTVGNATSAFNTYALEWRPHQVDFFVNGTKYLTFNRNGRDWSYWPFNKDFNFRLNVAVGGDWGGAQGIDDSIFPRSMEVDYVRVFKMNSTPYTGTPVNLPGRIEAENFDNGGEGFAYHDVDAANNGGQYRTTGVDLGSTMDGYTSPYVGWLATDEWLTYTVNLTKSTNYGFTVRVASPYAGKSFYFEVDDKRATPDFVVPNTGGWANWQSIAWTKVYLPAGQHKIRLVSNTDGYNVNWIDVWDAGP